MTKAALHTILTIVVSTIAATLLVACSGSEKRYRIGVSQCSADIWRDKQNAELRMAAYFHENVELRFAAAYDNDERQIQQIDSLVDEGIDLLIVAPNQVATISPAIDRAFDKGLPVIVFERKTNSHKYTAYIGADNYEMGRMMGEYIVTRLKGHGTVMELMGLKGSSPAIERHKGLREAIALHPGIEVVATLQGDWTEPTAYNIVKDWKDTHPDIPIDLVFGMNDRSAMGARRAFEEHGGPLPLFCGIDGLPGENGGIRLVRDSLLDASYIYPTHGDQLIQLAVDILEHKPYDKEKLLMSALVTKDNASVLLMENEEIVRQSAYLDELHEKANDYLQKLDTQRLVTLFAIGFVVLLLIAASALYLYFRQKTRIQAEREQMTRDQLDFYTQASHQLRTPLTLIEGPLAQLAQTDEMKGASAETMSTFDIIQRNTTQLSALVNKILDVQTGKDTKQLTPQEIDLLTTQITKEVESVPEQGGSVEPAVDGQPTDDEKEKKPCLLVVDDNADIRAYLRSILKGHYIVCDAADGQQGLEMARREVPDLIISDVMMPVMNGLEFCQHVKDDFITSHIPVILLTARAMSQHQVEGYKSGADAYITKPFSPELLLARIDNLLRNRVLLKNLWENEQPATGSNTRKESADTAQPEPKMENTFLSRFKTYVEAHLADSELSVETIGQELGLSRVQLYRKIKALTGSTPIDLLRKARLAHARQLLSDASLSVSEIAYQSGFTSPSYFTKCFKDEYGMVPGDMRK